MLPYYLVSTKTLQINLKTSSVISVPSLDETEMTPSPKGKANNVQPHRFCNKTNPATKRANTVRPYGGRTISTHL